MRAIYNLNTMESKKCDPIIKKIFGTFFLFWIILCLIALLIFFGILQQKFSYVDALYILKQIFISFLLISMILLFVLWILLKNSISPLIKLIIQSKNSVTLQKIEVPKNTSAEIQDLYEIMNNSILCLQKYQTQKIESEKNAAIASTIQMLAHDVRNPFSLLRMAITVLSNAKGDATKISFILNNIAPEVDRAIRKVNAMLTDVMEIGTSSENLLLEPTCPESLIELTLTESFRTYHKSNIFLSYHFSHSHMLKAHSLKLERVFSNILVNAIEAMNYKGDIWFQTKEVLNNGIYFVEFCIGNNNSYISEEDIKNLFKVFFTRYKNNGTGLGLAIAEKIVKEHGGKIWCTSEKNKEFPTGKVEFWFLLPIAKDFAKKICTSLPSHSSEMNKIESTLSVEEAKNEQNKIIQTELAEIEIENKIIKLSKNLSKQIHLLIVDDEMIYRNILIEILSKIYNLNSVIKIFQAEGSKQALSIIQKQKIDLILTDYDMGSESLNGIELIKEMKHEKKISSFFCIHSNRLFTDSQKFAVQNGIDVFIPKPITKEQLLKLILHAGLRFQLNHA